MLVFSRKFQITAEEEELQLAIEESFMGRVGTEKYLFSFVAVILFFLLLVMDMSFNKTVVIIRQW